MKKYDDKGNQLGIIANDLSSINTRIRQKIFRDYSKDVSQIEGNYMRSNEWEGIIANELSLSNRLLVIISDKILGSLK